jgi:putative FmdB family regulatory protein
MPTYEYKCGHCGRFQTAQPITEPALKVCPTCGQPVQRLISRNIGIVFKGSGFYCTDHRGKTNLIGSEEKGSKPADAGGKTEAKPADAGGKTEAKTAEAKTAEAKTGQGSCSDYSTGKTKAAGKQ